MPENEKKLFLLDAFALIYRAYYAFIKNPRVNSKGLNTSAIFGFVNTLTDVLNNEKPSHIAVVFDTPTATERHIEFTDYKANREAMPEDIALAIPYIKEIIKAFNIPVISSDGYEADDVIGTLAKKAEKEGFITYMMTPDKDFGQLVSENIFMYKPARSGNKAEIWGPKEVCEKFEITNPLQVIDILALMGDAVDNIPGVPGVGEKTAKKFIGEFGSVENLLENTDKLTGSIKEKVAENKDKALMSKKLATIILDAPVDFDEKKLLLEPINKEKLLEIFSELEFRALSRRILGEEIKASGNEQGQMDLFGHIEQNENATAAPDTSIFSTIKDTQHNYILAENPEQFKSIVEAIQENKAFCFDTETTGLDPLTVDIVGLSICFEAHKAFYIPFSPDREKSKAILQHFKSVFEDESILKIAQNIKYDMKVLGQYDIDVRGNFFDTMIAHYLLIPNMRHNMDLLAETYLNYSPVSIKELIGKKGKEQKNMQDVPIEQIKEYAAEDADITFQLYQYLKKELDNHPKTKSVFETMEMPLVKVLCTMETEGIKIDVPALQNYSVKLQSDIEQLEKDIKAMAGVNFNIDSPKQLGDVLFINLKLSDKPKKTKTGQFATGEDILEKLKDKHNIINKILDYRQFRKLKNTYVDPLPSMINAKTGRLHTSYLQTVASTGRLSSANPNLQNIPVRTKEGREIRKAFIARNENHQLLSADYSQIELRIIAALSNEENMIAAFTNGEDIHAATAAKVFGVSQAEVTREMRSKAKAVNFGIIYGQSAFGLAQNLNISRSEAKEIIDSYFDKYPRIKGYMDEVIARAKKDKYLETIMGRRSNFADIDSNNAIVRRQAERNAINAPIQGSAADIIKIAMINIQEVIDKEKIKSRMLLQVHDELVFDVINEEAEMMLKMVKEKMENAVKIAVPLEVEANLAANWLGAH